MFGRCGSTIFRKNDRLGVNLLFTSLLYELKDTFDFWELLTFQRYSNFHHFVRAKQSIQKYLLFLCKRHNELIKSINYRKKYGES